MEHDQFVEADFGCGVDCNKMGKFYKDDSDDIQSMEEACLDDKNLCTPLMIKDAMTDVLTTWKGNCPAHAYHCKRIVSKLLVK